MRRIYSTFRMQSNSQALEMEQDDVIEVYQEQTGGEGKRGHE